MTPITKEEARGNGQVTTGLKLNQEHPQNTTEAAGGKPLCLPALGLYENATATKQCADLTIEELFEAVSGDEFKEQITKLRAMLAAGDDDGYAVAKKDLMAVSISASVKGRRKKAAEEGRMIHTGFIQVDLDAGPNVGWTVEEMRAELIAIEHIQGEFITPSGEGVKGLFRISPVPAGVDLEAQHKHAFEQVAKLFEQKNLTIDPACCDPVRLAFVSHDPEAWLREEEATPMLIDPLPPQTASGRKEPSQQPAAVATRKGLIIRETGGHRDITADDVREMLAAIPPRPEYSQWLRIASAVWDAVGEATGTALLNEWSPEEDPGEYVEKFKDRLTEVHAGTLVMLAKQHGWLGKSPAYRIAVSKSHETPLPVDFPDLARYGESDADNALRVHAVAGGNFHHVAESGQWLVWDGCRWNPDKDGKMVRLYLATMEAAASQAITMENRKAGEALVKHAMRCRDAAKVASALTMLKSVQGVTISANDLDADPWLLGTPSGLIDLRTGHPTPPDKRALVTKSIACDFDPEATCPTWERVIHTAAAGDAELIRFLQAWTGYTLTGSVKEECLAFLHGTGANSKGTVTECIRALMGDYAMTAPESLFVVDRNSSATNDIARLSGCRMACAAELDESASFAESRLKAITGRDAITARFLHREFFDFQPTHKFWISGNHKPSVRGVDHGIWRRIRLIPFTVTIPKEERDLELADKLRAELPGILNWAIAGCLLWQREGLQTPQCIAKATADYQAAEDVVGQFLDDCSDADSTERTLQSSLYQCYQAWAEKQGIKKPLTATILNRKLEERGMKRGKIQGGIYWHEIGIKSD